MSAGKVAAQVGHCSESYWINLLKRGMIECTFDSFYLTLTTDIPKEAIREYALKDMTKTICQAKNKNHLLKAVDMAIELGLHEGEDYGFIYDKSCGYATDSCTEDKQCLTELTPEEANGTTLTGMWFRPLPDDVAHGISRHYQLYVG